MEENRSVDGKKHKMKASVGGKRFEECQLNNYRQRKERDQKGEERVPWQRGSLYELHLLCAPSTFQFQFLLLNQKICINSCKNISSLE